MVVQSSQCHCVSLVASTPSRQIPCNGALQSQDSAFASALPRWHFAPSQKRLCVSTLPTALLQQHPRNDAVAVVPSRHGPRNSALVFAASFNGIALEPPRQRHRIGALKTAYLRQHYFASFSTSAPLRLRTA